MRTEITERKDISNLKRFYDKILSIFASSVETEMGLRFVVDWVGNAVKSTSLRPETTVHVGKGNPNLPSAAFQYEKPAEALMQDSSEGGRNVRLHRNGVIALTYALWEDEYRASIAADCGLASKDELQSVVFQDLNKYRQAILHQSGRLDREPVKMCFFAKGDVVSFTKDQMHDLFTQLIAELNRIGEEYFGQNPQFKLDKPLN